MLWFPLNHICRKPDNMCSDFKVFRRNPLELPVLWKYYEKINFPERKGNFPNIKFICWSAGYSRAAWTISVSLSTLIWEQWRILSTDYFSSFEQYWVWSSRINQSRSCRSPAICTGLKHVEPLDCKQNVWQGMCLASPTPFWLLTYLIEAKLI